MTKTLPTLSGSGGGSKYKRTKDNLFSTDIVEIILGVSEGPIKGLRNGGQSFFIGDTPLMDTGDKANFKEFELITRAGGEVGEEIVSRLGGFASNTPVNTELASNIPVVRSGTHTDIDYLDVRMVINRLIRSTDKGEYEWRGTFRIEYRAVSSPDWLSVGSIYDFNNQPQIEIGNNVTQYLPVDIKDPTVEASVGDGDIVWSDTPPGPGGAQSVWFNKGDNNKPYTWNGSQWVLALNTTVLTVDVGQSLTWSMLDNRGNLQTRAVSIRDTAPPRLSGSQGLMRFFRQNGRIIQGDIWLRPSDQMKYIFNGSTFIEAGSSRDLNMIGVWNGNPSLPPPSGSSARITISGKTTSPYVREYRIPVPRINEPYQLRVTKLTGSNTTETFFDITWESFQEVSADPITFPGLATAQLLARASDQFSSIPDFSGEYDGRLVKVPSNYDPVARTYAGFWDGTWKIAFTDNPAYIALDLVDNDRYGLNAYYPVVLNKYDVYAAGQWCDERRADGKPRFTFNGLIDTPRGGREAVQYVCGTFGGRFFDDGNGNAVIRIDRDTPYVHIYTPENVAEGIFTYSWTDLASRYNDITVTFINPDLNWQEDRRRVYDQSVIDDSGRVPLNFIAVGCTNAAEAYARGRYKLITGLTETRIVNFRTNRSGLYLEPYDIILIADEEMDEGLSGRVKAVEGSRGIRLRDPLVLEAGIGYRIRFQTIRDGDVAYGIETREIDQSFTGALTYFEVTEDLPELIDDVVFSVETVDGTVAPVAYRVTSIKETEGDPDNLEIQAVQVNRAKWLYVDGHLETIEDVIEFDLSSRTQIDPIEAPQIRVWDEQSGTRRIANAIIDWIASPNPFISRYRIYASKNNGPENLIGETHNASYEWNDIPLGDYIFSITAVHITGQESPPVYIEHRFVGDYRPLEDITELRMVDEPSETIFESRSPVFAWPASQDINHEEYVVQVVDTTGTTIYEENLVENTFRFEYALNVSLGNGTPRRKFTVRVASQDRLGFRSSFTELTVENPPPAAPENLRVRQVYNTTQVSFDIPGIRDYVGCVVHHSGSNDQFVPSEINRVYKGPSNDVPIMVDRKSVNYFKVALYDSFGEVNLNFSPATRIDIDNYEIIDTTPPGVPTNVTTRSGMRAILVSWVNPPDEDLGHIEVFTNTVDNLASATLSTSARAPGDSVLVSGILDEEPRFIWLRAVDTVGNRSEFTASVTATAGLIGSGDIAADVIMTNHLAAEAVTAEKLSVNELSAITSNFGHMDAGSINIADRFQVNENGEVTISGRGQGARLVITNELIQVFDHNNVLRARFGIWS